MYRYRHHFLFLFHIYFQEQPVLHQLWLYPFVSLIGKKIADRLRNVRKRRSISQEKLANMSGVSYGSIKRFEATGQISLISLIKIATALGVADELRELFTDVPYRNIQEVINETK